MATATFLNSTVSTVRRTRRAYIGAHVMAFEFAAKRAAMRLNQLRGLTEVLVTKGEAVEADLAGLTKDARAKVADVLPGEAKVKVEIDVTPTAKRTAKKPAAKKSSKTRMTTEKTLKTSAKVETKVAKTPKAKKTETVKFVKTEDTAAQAGQILTDKYDTYQAGVAKYDANANPVVVKKIVDHLGIALSTRDGKFVACTDASERETVAKSWLLKTLGVEGDMAALDAKVGAVCDIMKADRLKSRVTFYYLLAKAEGKLGTL